MQIEKLMYFQIFSLNSKKVLNVYKVRLMPEDVEFLKICFVKKIGGRVIKHCMIGLFHFPDYHEVVKYGVTSVRLISSGFFENSVTVEVLPLKNELLDANLNI